MYLVWACLSFRCGSFLIINLPIANFRYCETSQSSFLFFHCRKRIFAEAYSQDLEATEIHMNFLDGRGGVVSSSEEFELYQNQPNPFDQSTYVGFSLPKAQDAAITVFDVTGKTVKLISGSFGKGYNQILLSSDDLGKSGVLYYRLETEDRMATKKMILIE